MRALVRGDLATLFQIMSKLLARSKKNTGIVLEAKPVPRVVEETFYGVIPLQRIAWMLRQHLLHSKQEI